MGGTSAVSGFLQGFLGPVEKKIQQQHDEAESQKAELRKQYLPIYMQPGLSDGAREQVGKALKGTMSKQAWDSLSQLAPIGQKIAGHIADQQQSPGAAAVPLPQAQQQGPGPQGSAPSLPPAPGPAQGPAAAALPLPPPAASPLPATNPMNSAYNAQSQLHNFQADLDEQRKIKTARDMIPVDIEKQTALLPGEINKATAIAQAQNMLESQAFKTKVSAMEEFQSRKFEPEELSKIALHQLGLPAIEGRSSEKIDVKGPDGKMQVAFRDPTSGKIFDAEHHPIDMSKGFQVVEKPPESKNSVEVRDLTRLAELNRKKTLTPEEMDEKSGLEYRKKQLDDTAKRADTRVVIQQQNAARAAGTSPADPGTREWAQDLAADVVEHRMSPSQLMQQLGGGRSETAAARRRMVEREIKQLDPKFNFQQAEADYSFSKNPSFQNTIRFMDSVSGSIPIVIKRANELGNGNIRLINGLANLSKDQLNDPKLKKFQTDALLVADEIAKILQGGGTGNGTSDAKMRQAQQIIRASDSPKAIAAALEDVQQLIGYRRESLTTGTYLEGTEPRTPGSNAIGKPNGKPKTAEDYLKSLGK